MAVLITRIIAKRTQFSKTHKRYWELWSEARASPVPVFEDELEKAHWLEEEAKKLRNFMLRMPEGQEKTLDAPAVIEVDQDEYYEVARVVKGPPVSAEECDWIDEMASRIRQQVAELQSVQQDRIAELENELADKQRCIDELAATVQTQQARLTALENQVAQAKVEPTASKQESMTDPDVLTVDVHPAESVPEDEEDGAWSAANLFHPVDPALADEDADDLPVPPRRSEIEVSSTDAFLEQAREYVNRTETAAVPVSYQEYQPTYASMSAKQKQWYFYWRTQLRQGNQLTIDLSYLFVHIYEVINLVGFQSPQEAFEYLEDFWRYYRKLRPELDNYLSDWLADFLAVHELPLRPLQWYHKVAKFGMVVDQNLLIEAWLASGGDFESLPNDILFGLANYNPTKNRFYQRYAKSLRLDEAYKRGLTAVDEVMRSETGKSLFQTCQSQRSRVIKRPPFKSAIHTYSQIEIKIATVHFWSGNRRLAEILSGIIKCAESIMGKRVGYHYESYRIELKWKQAIEFALVGKTAKQESVIEPPQAALPQESVSLRSLLVGAAESAADVDSRPDEQVPPQEDEDAQRPASPRLAADDPDDLPDLSMIANIIGAGESDNKRLKLIEAMMKNGWECTVDDLKDVFEDDRNVFVDVIIDDINERAQDAMDDNLLEFESGHCEIHEDYRDAIKTVLTHPDEYRR